MEIAAAIVSVVFGGLVGWGAVRRPSDRRPLLVALATGAVLGAMMWSLSLGDDPALSGGSLLLGGLAGTATLLLARRRPA